MSAPFPSVACEGCDQDISQTETTGFWFWQYDGNRVCPMDQQIGYCRTCAGLSFIGLAPPERGNRYYAWQRYQLADRESWMRSIWTDLPEVTLDLAMRFRVRRRHHGLCLICGGTETTPIRIPRYFPYRGHARWDTGLRHEGCGGRIVIKGAEHVRSWPAAEWRIFDLAGRQVYGEPLRHPSEPRGDVVMTIREMCAVAASLPPDPAPS